MKTNQNLTRQMGDFEVIQRTKDSYFDASLLIRQWNEKKCQSRKLSRFLESPKTKEFIRTIERKESQGAEMHNGVFQVVIRVKGRNTKNGKRPDQTWMHPFLFLDFAMWINSSFKYEVINFVYDELIRYRNNAGDSYRNLSSAVQGITPKRNVSTAMRHIAQGMNYVVFGKHQRDIRNSVADESMMKELYSLEEYITKAIKDGFLKSYEDVIQYLRREWHRKQTPEIFAA